MAKFSEVMRQWDRMCKSIGVHDRVECPLVHAFDIPNCESCYDYALEDSAQTEEIVMSWAAENPEPKPITWADWLTEMGVIHNASFSIWGNEFDGEAKVSPKMFMPIPADIAEKLGIEPKENT